MGWSLRYLATTFQNQKCVASLELERGVSRDSIRFISQSLILQIIALKRGWRGKGRADP